ncbi:hypothetical protein BS47DRAFT_1485832 [Hydnum rufescens UP504]|uniref:Wax synthase domain-containing protein n=1 Tax=Hydnum rufescens UP504 TaxID=1448309 RepID=A0A9P6AWA2_9AGAM|nr:hypothetical protein BS47DRAFT_1485832 [Hydnum rufescens UP504]
MEISRLQENLHFAFRHLVPPASSRTPINWGTAHHVLVPIALHLVLAYLARRPGTRVMRAALFPFVCVATIRFGYGYECTDVMLNAFNWGVALAAILWAFKAVEFGLAPNGILKVGEIEPGVLRAVANGNGNGNGAIKVGKMANGSPAGEKRRPATRPSGSRNIAGEVLAGLRDAIEVESALRGIGWEAGTGSGIYIPQDTRDTAHPARFSLQTLRQLIFCFLATDLLESCLKLVPGLGTPAGGSMFAFGSNVYEKYLISTGIHLITGFAILSGFAMAYYLITLIAVSIFQHHPTSWPPVFDSPWASTSLHEFWSKKWHQLLRQTFLVMGGFPLQKIFGSSGLIFGTFLASGLYHECALYAMGRGFGVQCVIFFALQPVAIVLERLFRRRTGAK